MTVVAIIGTVIAIALPRLEKAKIQAKAVSVAADVRLIQEAVANYAVFRASGQRWGTSLEGAGLPQVSFVTNKTEGLFVLRALRPLLTGGRFAGGSDERPERVAPNPLHDTAVIALDQARQRLAAATPGTPAAAAAQAAVDRLQDRLQRIPKTNVSPPFSTFTYRFDL